MKIISIAYPSGTDFAFCVVDDDVAKAYYARCRGANHRGRFSLGMFSLDSPDGLLSYIQVSNDEKKQKDG